MFSDQWQFDKINHHLKFWIISQHYHFWIMSLHYPIKSWWRVKSRLSRSCPKRTFYGFPRPNLDNWPDMDKLGCLKMLLDTLLDKETLNSWQIYEEKNDGSVVVRIRFAARHCRAIVTGATNVTDEENIIPYKRKSPAQIRWDNERAKQHPERWFSRSQTLNAVDNIVPRDISEPEFVRSSDNDLFSDTRNPGLVSPVPCAVEPTSALDPLVSSFTPASLQFARSDNAPAGSEDMALAINHFPNVSHPDIKSASLDLVTSSLPCSQISDPDDSADERGSLCFHLDAAVLTDDRHSIHSTASVYVDGLAVVSKVGLGNGKPNCQNYSCMYGGGLSREDIDYIYKCPKCEGPHTSSLCAKCMLNGRCCEPGHENWELIT